MRTIHTIKSNNAGVVSYYENDESLNDSVDYYSESEQSRLTASQWHGNGAKLLGLSGEVEREIFKQVLRGENPITGDRLRPFPAEGVERYGIDVTLSAPKSVSMALHIGGDERIFYAHLAAVKKTLDTFESMYSQVRSFKDGERVIKNSGNVVAALINHHTSRELDCQLHTHTIVMNATLREDGKWRSLYPEGIMYADWIGSYYRTELNKNLNELGYATYKTRDAFELEGFSRRDIKTFSKRTVAATKRVQERGQDLSAENIKQAAYATRKAKKIDQTLEELQIEWRKEADKAGIIIPSPADHPIIQTTTQTPEELIDSAIAHYSERLVSFRREDLYRYAFDKVHGHSLADINQAINHHPELISHGENEYTTVTALERELKSVELLNMGKGKFESLGVAEDLFESLDVRQSAEDESKSLNAGQQKAIESTLDSMDQIMIWHGKAGVGKTYALGKMVNHIHLPIKGFAPTRKAAEELSESLDIEAQTVQSHLLKQDSVDEPELWIVDEAGLLDAKQGLELLEKANQQNARVLLVGDIRQNQSIGAGSFLKSLITHGAQTTNLSQIIRQENDIQKRAVELISSGSGVEALALLDEHGYINEAQNQDERAQAIADEYLGLSETQRANTLIVAGTNADRLAISKSLRDGFRKEGKLGDDHEVKVLKDLSFTVEQGRDINNFEVGDFLRLERKYATRVQRGTLHEIIGKDGNELILRSANGQINRIEPRKYQDKSVYSAEPLQMAKGDRVRFCRTGLIKGLRNGDELFVSKITEKSITLKGSKGTYTIPRNQPLDLDYGYTITSYRGQGQCFKRVLVSASSDQTSCIEPFYVAASRQRQILKVWSEDKKQFYKLVKQSLSQRNPIQLITESNYEQRNHDPSRKIDPIRESAKQNRTEATRSRSEGLSNSARDSRSIKSIDRAVDRDIQQASGEIRTPRTTEEINSRNPKEHGLSLGDDRNVRNKRFTLSGDEESIAGIDRTQLESIASAIQKRWIEDSIEPQIRELTASVEQRNKASRLIAGNLEEQKQIQSRLDSEIQSLARGLKIKALSRTVQAWRELSVLEDSAQLVELARSVQSRVEMQQTEQWLGVQKLGESLELQSLEQSQALNQLTELVQDFKAEQAIAQAMIRFQQTIELNTHRVERIKPKRPKPIPIYWQPKYKESDRPQLINEKHWEEFKKSGIHPDLLRLNIESLEGIAVQIRLLEEELSKMGSGQFPTKEMSRLMDRYQCLTEGGWWAKTIDPKTWELSTGGCFKGDNPRIVKGEVVKYENPKGLERQFYLAQVPDWLATDILKKHGIEFKHGDNFWKIVHEQNLPVTYTEGYKKALAGLSQGEIVIGVSGANAFYKANEKVNGEKFKLAQRELTPPAKIWATPGREINFALDQDTKLSAILNVRRDLVRAIELHPENTITVTSWDTQKGKGMDDLIIQSGPREFTKALARRRPAAKEVRAHYRYQYNRYKKQGLSDAQIWLKACRENDVRDGDRVLSQSDYVRKHPEQAEEYIKQQKTAALEAMQRKKKVVTSRSSRSRSL